MHYSDKREAKVKVCHALEEKGWKVYGFDPDQSDSMTDYYHPASWDGIAEKNGYVLVIDQHNTCYSGYELKKYNYNKQRFVANERIVKLTAMMNDSASTENEKASCAALIGKEKAKAGIEPEYTIIETYPTFKHGNPKSCSWHIEKDGQIIAKGKGVFSVNEYDWENKEKSATEQKAEKVQKFVNKIEKVLSDSDALITEVIKVPVTKIKPVEKVDNAINVNDLLSFSYHGHYWVVTDVYTVREQVRVVYELLGSEKRGYKRVKNSKRYYQPLNRLQNEMTEGKVKVYTLQEVTEFQEKTIFKKTGRKQSIVDAPAIETTEEIQQAEKNETNTYSNDQNNNHATLNINNSKNGIEIKFNYKPSTNVIDGLKEMGFRWSSYNSVWWAKQSPERVKFAQMFVNSFNDIAQEEPEAANNNTVSESIEQQQTDDKIQTQIELEENQCTFNVDTAYMYHDIHFKSWNMSEEEISEELIGNGIPFDLFGGKFICKGLMISAIAYIETLNNRNAAIIFYDNKYNEKPNNSLTDKEQNNDENTILMDSNVIYHDFNGIEEPSTEGKKTAQKEGNTTMFDFDDILGKFETVDVTRDSIIAADDQEFCKEQESIYRDLISTYNSFYNSLQEISEVSKAHGQKFGRKVGGYYHEQHTAHYRSMSKYDYNKAIEEMKNSFILYVCSYFERKYNITIDESKIKCKYNETITYEKIIDEIYIQLDGFNFTEKAEKEIKVKVKELVRNSDKIAIKNNKLIIDAWFSRHDSIWKEFRINGDKCAELFNALQHFDNGSVKGNQELNDKYIGFDNERNQSNFERYELISLSKAKSIKFLKNGKLEIAFTSNQLAVMFAKEYCGYKQQSA